MKTLKGRFERMNVIMFVVRPLAKPRRFKTILCAIALSGIVSIFRAFYGLGGERHTITDIDLGSNVFEEDIPHYIKYQRKPHNKKRDYERDIPSLQSDQYDEYLALNDTETRRPFEFRNIPDTEVYVISAFLDVRLSEQHKVKIIAIAPKDTYQLWCHFGSIIVEADIDVNNAAEQLNCHWKPTFIICPLPYLEFTPSVVFLTKENKRSGSKPGLWVQLLERGRDSRDVPNTVGLCIKTMFNFNKIDIRENIIEYMESQRLLGVNKMYVYGVKGSMKSLESLLNYYQNKGFLEVIPWDFPKGIYIETRNGKDILKNNPSLYDKYMLENGPNPHCVVRYDQISAYRDCLYRHMDTHKYLAFMDLDELIVPIIQIPLPIMLDSVNKIFKYQYASIFFRYAQFCNAPTNANSKFGLMNMQRTRRLRQVRASYNGKSISIARLVDDIDVHLVKKTIYKDVKNYRYMGYRLGKTHQYHLQEAPDCTENNSVIDTTMKRYSPALQEAMHNVRQDLKQF